MIECSQAQEALLAGSGLVHELPEAIQEHVGACDACSAFALKRRRLRRLAKSTQEIVRKEFDLPPSAWARIRNSVEEEAKPEPFIMGFLRWFPVAALPVLIIALGWVLLDQKSDVGEQGAPTPKTLTQSNTSSKLAVKLEQGEFKELGQEVGSSIEAGDAPSMAALELGHRLGFQPHSKVGIIELSDKRVALQLEAGQITCEVRKLRSDESFVVVAKGMRVSVVGTRFTVALDEDGVPSVSVSDGQVSVTRDGHENAMLGPGDTLKDNVTEGPAPVAQDDNTAPQADADVSGVPIMRDASKKAAPRKARKKVVAAKAKSSETAVMVADKPARDAEDDAEKVIEVTVSETMAPQDVVDRSGIRGRLVGVIGMIRSGNCSAAQAALTTINLIEGASHYRGDITYLSGYCHRKQGDVGRAERLFRLYEKLGANRRWKIPTSHDEILPIPSPSHLRR